MIMANGINNDEVIIFNSNYNDYSYMYYSNSNAKAQLETWYTNNIASNIYYASKVVTGNYFCEQAKVTGSPNWKSGSADMKVYSSYIPDFKCTTDGNGKGLVNTSVGIINYDEVVFAGGYPFLDNSSYYLYNNKNYWIMNPAGLNDSDAASVWYVYYPGTIDILTVNNTFLLRPVINLKADTAVIGSGTSTDPWTVV